MISSSVILRTEQGVRFITAAAGPGKVKWIERVYDGVSELFDPTPPTITNIRVFATNRRWYSAFTKDNVEFIREF